MVEALALGCGSDLVVGSGRSHAKSSELSGAVEIGAAEAIRRIESNGGNISSGFCV